MEQYNIEHQHQLTENQSKHSFLHCIVIGCAQDTNTDNLFNNHYLFSGNLTQLDATQLEQLPETQTYSLLHLNVHLDPHRIIFHDNDLTKLIIFTLVSGLRDRKNLTQIHSTSPK